MKKNHEKEEIYQRINELLIAKIRQGTLPWKQSWNTFGPARNYITNRPYRGINALLLSMISAESEYPYFLTFHQAKQLGAGIKKGSKSYPVIYWKKLYYSGSQRRNIRIEELSSFPSADIKIVPLLKYYNVFNIDCLRDIEICIPTANHQHTPIVACESILSEMPDKPEIIFGGDQPCYNKATDAIHMPGIRHFTSEEAYYSVLFHELAHSTGHSKRLNRSTLTESAGFASMDYCKEELIAEIATCFICSEVNIHDQIIDNSAAYLHSWLNSLNKHLEVDPGFIIKASAEAQKAADYILNRYEDNKEEVPSYEEKLEGA